MAEQEMIEKKERFHRGKRRLAEEGRFNGGNIPFGYRIDKEKNNLIVIDEDEAALVKEVFNLYESGISQPKLAKEFYRRGIKKLTMSFINNILNNERYTGSKRVYPGSSFERVYPVIITPEQFKRCRFIAKENDTNADKTKNIYYAQNLIICKECGCKWSSSGSKVLYHCYDANNPNRKYDHYTRPQCTCTISISINIMDSLLWAVAQRAELRYILSSATEDKQLYQERLKVLNQKIAFISERLSELDDKRTRIVDSYIDGDITKEKRNQRFQLIEQNRREVLLDQVRFEEEKTHIEGLLSDLDKLYDLNSVEGIVNQIDRNIELQDRIRSITDDSERSRIVHRHIKKVSIENTKVDYDFAIGRRTALSRFITIELYNGDINYFHFIPNTGKGGLVIISNKDKELIEKLDFEYLDRYYDEGKRRRQIEAREKSLRERQEKYPSDKYILSYSGLAKFLCVGISTAHRWVEKLGILKPAVVERYKKEIVIDKKKCLELLKAEAKHNAWAKRILDGMKI